MLHTRDANIEGGGEARNKKDRVSVFTVERHLKRHLKMTGFLVTKKSYEINLCFVQRP